jgi:amino acid adenylation domain-containing protein
MTIQNFDLLVTDLIEKSAKKYPSHLALQDAHSFYNYQELTNLVKNAALFLMDSGVKKGNVVALISESNNQFPILMLAIFKIGGILLSIDASIPIERKKIMLVESKAKFIVSPGKHLLEAELSKGRKTLDWQNGNVVYQAKDESWPLIKPIDPAYIFFTSGSTGKPKGILGSHQGLSHFLSWQSSAFSIDSSDRCAQLTRLSFDVVLRSTLLALIKGAALIFPPHHDLASPETIHWLIREKITYFNAVPTLVKNWLYDLDQILNFPNLRYIFFAGEKLENKLIKQFKHSVKTKARFINLYGPTETVLAKCFYILPNSLKYPGVQPIGKPLPNTEILIINKEGKQCAIQEEGEIVIKTQFCSLGYINDKKEMFKIDQDNPEKKLYYTGDLGLFDEDGLLLIRGRSDDQIKINGVRIEPGEIEFALDTHNAIKKSAVSLDENNEIVAYLVLNNQAKPHLTKENILTFLTDYFTSEMLPKKFKSVETLPYTDSGKLNRKRLPLIPFELIKSDTAANDCSDTRLSKYLYSVFKKIFKLKSIEKHDSFFDWGLDSLKAARTVYHLNQQLGCNLKVLDLYNYKSIYLLENYLKKTNNQEKISPIILPHTIQKKWMPLSPQQEQFAFFQSVNPQSPAYHVSYCFQYPSNINSKTINETLHILMRIYPILTISIERNRNKLKQKFNELIASPFHEIELAENENISPLLQTLINEPFELDKAPLFRVALINQGDQSFLLFVFHHVLTDGITTSLFMNKFAHYFGLVSKNLSIKIDDIDRGYMHFIHEKIESKSALNFWINELIDFQFTDLVYDHHKTKSVKNPYQNGKTKRFFIAPDLKKNLSIFCMKNSITKFGALLTAFGILLSRYTGQDDIIVGVPFHNRLAQGDDVMGCFANTLPIRFLYDQSESFINLCKKLNLKIANTMEYQNVSLSAIVRKLKLSGNIHDNPLFEVFFSYESDLHEKLRLNNLEGKRYWVDNDAAKFELSIIIYSTKAQKLMVEIEYNNRLFDKNTINKLFKNYQITLEKLIQSSPGSASFEAFCSTDENKKLLEVNHHPLAYNENKDLISLIEDHVNSNPDKIAIEDEIGKINYQDLWIFTHQIIDELNKINILQNEVIAVCIPRSQHLVIAMLAIWYVGAVYLPLDPDLPSERLKTIILDAKPRCLIHNNSAKLNEIIPNEFKKKIPLILFKLKHHSYFSSEVLRVSLNLDSPAYLLYTSGTTGKPKGVLQTHRTLVNLFYEQSREINNQKGLAITQMASSLFDVSLQEISFTLGSGGTLFIVPKEYKLEPDKLWDFLIDKQINIVFLPPALLQLLAEFSDRLLPMQLHYLITAGEALLITPAIRSLMSNLTNCKLTNQYGPTETHVASAYCLAHHPATWLDYPAIGKPIMNIGFAVLDKYLNFLPPSMRGELFICGDNLAIGYLNQNTLTDERFVFLKIGKKLKRFYKTGDLVVQKKDREFYFNGRIDNQLNIKGFRIEPAEIEHQLLSYPNISNCIVISRKIEESLTIVAYYKTSNSLGISDAILGEFLAKLLPDYMKPTYYMHVKNFPLNANGKVDVGKLPLPSRPEKKVSSEETTPRQQEILSICQKILKTPPFSIEDNLLQIGFDSLSMANLVASLNRQYAIQLSLETAFLHPCVKALSDYVNQEITSHPINPLKKSYKMQTTFTMSLQQQRIWNDIKRGQNPVANNLSLALSLSGHLNKNAIDLAINSLLEQYDIFHLYLKPGNEDPVIQAKKKPCSRIIYLDYSKQKLTDNEWYLLLEDKMHENLYPFDSGFYKIYLIKLNDKKHIFLLIIHHFIFDGTSIQLFLKELAERYSFFCLKNNTLSSYQKTVSSYQEFCLKQTHELNTIWDSDNTYFKEILGKTTSLLSYPLTRKTIPLAENTKSTQHFSIENKLFTRLKNLASENKMTLFSVLLHCFSLLIRQYTHDEQILIGTTVNGRIDSQFADTLGLFSQRTLISIIQPEMNLFSLKKSEEAIHKCLQHQQLSLYDHPDYEIFLANKNIVTAQFNMVFQNFLKIPLNLTNLNVKNINLHNRYYSLDVTDITFVLEEAVDKIIGEVVYQKQSYSDLWVEQFIKNYLAFLRRV